MFGKLLGELISAPIRLAGIPGKILGKTIGYDDGENICDEIADAIKEQCEKIDG